MVALAKKLARYLVNGRKRSLREVAAEFGGAGPFQRARQAVRSDRDRADAGVVRARVPLNAIKSSSRAESGRTPCCPMRRWCKT